MKPAVTILFLELLALLAWPSALMAQEAQKPAQGKQLTTSRDWTYSSRHMPLDLKWRRHLESNLRWMIARQLGDAARQKPRVAIYADAGTNYQLNRNIVVALESKGIGCRILDRSRINAQQLAGVEAYVMPGGYSTFQRHALGQVGTTVLRQFVDQGGRYLGVCAGGYVAAKDVHWEEKHYPYPLELFDGTAEGALDSIAAWPRDAAVVLKLTKAGKSRGLSKAAEGSFYYKGGPHFHGGTNVTVLATYPNGTAAIISRPFGKGEVVLNGIHFERPPPAAGQGDDVPPASAATGGLFGTLLQLEGKSPQLAATRIADDVIRWVEVSDLAKEDRVNLEQNLRWVLARSINRTTLSKKPSVGLFVDAGAEHASVVAITSLLESRDITVKTLLYTDVHKEGLQHLETFIVPAGNHRILRDTLGKDGQQALEKFIKSGKQYIGISTGAYLVAKTVRWQQRTWEYPLKYFWGRAEGPLAEIATWPASAEVRLEPTVDGVGRGLSKRLLATCRYHGGPRFVNGRGHQVLAQYPDATEAIVARKVGRGEVVLIGVEVTDRSQFFVPLLKTR